MKIQIASKKVFSATGHVLHIDSNGIGRRTVRSAVIHLKSEWRVVVAVGTETVAQDHQLCDFAAARRPELGSN